MSKQDAPHWMQRILFGPPGCGKSFHVRREAQSVLGISEPNSRRLIETTFHPEYGYGDFMAKLMPYSSHRAQKYTITGSSMAGTEILEHTPGPKIEYRIHVGPLLKALAVAYVRSDPVLLAIDEINRGNCAQIFGDVFQLLDRDAEGWSEYGIDMSDLFHLALEQELRQWGKTLADLPPQLKITQPEGATPLFKLKLPPNLSILATMNTSDESVYYMDTAFKRRWDFLYMPWEGETGSPGYADHGAALIEDTTHSWHALLTKLNTYVADHFIGRSLDDKQIGMWFLKSVPRVQPLSPGLEQLRTKLVPLIGDLKHKTWVAVFPSAKLFHMSKVNLETFSVRGDFESYGIDWPTNVESAPDMLAQTLIDCIDNRPKLQARQILRTAISNKLMFFLWDNVFTRDRTPLAKLLQSTAPEVAAPRTFGEFTTEKNVALFIDGLLHEIDAETGGSDA
jgi:5-methylcytosine-specific restriction protein B